MTQSDLAYEVQTLEELGLDDPRSDALLQTDGFASWTPYSSRFASRIIVKRYVKTDQDQVRKVQRELTALLAIRGEDGKAPEGLPELLDYFDPTEERIWVIVRDGRGVSMRRYVEDTVGSGGMAEGLLRMFVTQLFSAVAGMFMAGFAHLRICDETVFIDPEGWLMLRGFEYVHAYSKEERNTETGLYAAVETAPGVGAKYGNDIYTPPEAFPGAAFNARKATMWSCGVSLYYMATGQTEKLSNLSHPLFEHTTHDSDASLDPEQVNPEASSPSPRRSSIAALTGRRRSSTANSGSHSRKVSLTQPPTIISYPGSRLETPSWVRDIVSKMLITNPLRRAELIEVAAKVPKEVRSKFTRPLMELAWLDYKTHVGPLAGMEQPDFDDGASISSSLFSGVSQMSNPFASLLGGARRTSVGATKWRP